MRILVLSILCLGLLSPLSAQRGLKIGVFGVPQISYLNNADDNNLVDERYNAEALPTMAGGISIGLGFSDFFGLRFSPSLAQQGGAYTSLVGAVSTRFVERLNYAKLPLMFGFNTPTAGRKFSFSFYLGASADFLLGAKSFNDNPFIITPDNVSIPPVRDRYQNMVYSFIGETGFDIQLPPDNFTLNLRLRGDYGLTDAENKDIEGRILQNGQVSSFSYWTNLRGETRSAITQGLNLGLLIGLTYSFLP